jgi:sugar-specific transcriptional regulator TrmB
MDELTLVKEENEQLKKRIAELEEHLKKYTAPARSKTYYENHKEEIKKKVSDYKEKTNYNTTISKEKKKEYNKAAYERRKLKNAQLTI